MLVQQQLLNNSMSEDRTKTHIKGLVQCISMDKRDDLDGTGK